MPSLYLFCFTSGALETNIILYSLKSKLTWVEHLYKKKKSYSNFVFFKMLSLNSIEIK